MSATSQSQRNWPPDDKTPEQRAARIKWERKAIQQALESVEREGTIPFEEMEAWLDSLGTANELPPPEPRK
jgi:predicted transcriptional regulator